MSDVDVRAAGAHLYSAVLDDAGRRSEHHVSVPHEYLVRLGLPDTQEPLLVRQSLEYAVRHGAAASLPRRFPLDLLERELPGYPAEVVAGLAR